MDRGGGALSPLNLWASRGVRKTSGSNERAKGSFNESGNPGEVKGSNKPQPLGEGATEAASGQCAALRVRIKTCCFTQNTTLWGGLFLCYLLCCFLGWPIFVGVGPFRKCRPTSAPSLE